QRLHGFGDAPFTATAATRCHPHQCSQRASHPFTQRPAMKPRDFLNFFKTKSGKLVAFGALFAAALIIFSVFRKHHTSAEDAVSVTALATNATDKPQVVRSVVRPMQAFNPPSPKSEPTDLPSSLSPSPSSSSPAFTKPSPLPLVPAN